MKDQIKAFKEKKTYNMEDIRELVEILRSPDGCAWDREQTHKSVRNAMIEETYEFIEGLDKDDRTLMKEELGDVLFQVFFHARIAEESGNFSMDDIADEVCKKMVLRHPHVFGDVSVKNSDEVLQNWETIKKAEKSRDTLEKQLESVFLPSLKLATVVFKNSGESTSVMVDKLLFEGYAVDFCIFRHGHTAHVNHSVGKHILRQNLACLVYNLTVARLL